MNVLKIKIYIIQLKTKNMIIGLTIKCKILILNKISLSYG